MGWVPQETVTGDEICVFDGSKMPFVIRLVPSRKNNYYRLIGAAYMHGLMYGGARVMGKGRDKIITLV